MLELAIDALSHAGEGIARHAGRVVFVPFALPGERVRAEITQEKKTFARARLTAVLSPAPERVAPRCPHHFSPAPDTPTRGAAGSEPTPCGGCQLQHLAYAAQLKFKQQTVIEQLTRVGGIAAPPVRPTLPSPSPFNYRNQAQLSLAPEGRLGFQAANSRRVVPIRECHLMQPALEAMFPRIALEADTGIERVTLRAGADDEVLVVLEGQADSEAPELELDVPASVAWQRRGSAALTLAGSASLWMEVRGRTFQVSAASFFQVNSDMAAPLVSLVLEGLALQAGETVLDLYCGVGLFSAFLAPVAGRVIGVEAFGPAVEDAAANLDEFDNVEIYAGRAEAVLPGLGVRCDAAVLDPPRAGCAPEVVDALAASAARRLVYVSCDPATLARDAKRLAAQGFRLDWAQPLDMFPQTHHIECVARFSRGQG